MATDVTATLSAGGDGQEPRQAEFGDGVPAASAARNGSAASAAINGAAPSATMSHIARSAGLRPPAAPPAAVRPPRQRAGRGKHAAPKAGYLSTRGVRFVLFSAIGGSVFVMGLAIQYVLTGKFHLPSMWSYMIQAVVSVETNFLLNQWLTWRDRAVPFWTAFIRFNGQRTVTVALNSLLYLGLIRLGMNYLAANIALTAAFTVVNYLVGDLFVFTPRRSKVAKSTFDPSETLPLPRAPRPPDISVVIPCRNNQSTIKATVLSLLGQNYPGLRQLTLIGSPSDSTWAALADIDDPRLEMLELATPPGVRDANFKRDYGIRRAASDLVALVDSDVVLPSDWMSRAVDALDESRASCVTGGMRSVRDDFWGRYTDHTVVGAKTPRVAKSYAVTRENFGVGGRKPPITANILFKREFYDECPIDPYWSHGSYEDYEWFWRVVKAGHEVRVCWELFGWHHHRQGMSALIKEYRRSSRGCAYFVRAHIDSPLARRRLMQAVALPLLAIVAVIGLGVGVAAGYAAMEAEAALAGAMLVAGLQAIRARRLEGVAYAATGITLGLVFTTGLVTNLLRASTGAPDRATLPEGTGPGQPRGPLRYLVHPLTLICAVQAALSLTLVRSNTAFTDEADYLWLGRLRLAAWLHGTGWPSTTGQHILPGSPDIYPPIGAIVNAIGGLAGARIASLAFMLGATVLLYFMAQRLFDATVAAFAVGLWAISEPTLRLAFATADPLSVLLTALAGWLVVQAGHRRRHGELVAAAGAVLALATATSYAAIVIDPVVIAFALFAWLPRLGARQAAYSAGWLTAAFALFLGLLLTVSGSWSGFGYTAFGRYIATHQSATQVLNGLWNYTGLIVVLAVVGAVIAVSAEGAQRAALVGVLGCAALAVPAVQVLTRTTDLADRRLAYGMLFAVMAAGHGCAKVVRWLPGASRQFTLACCAVALMYPATAAWQSAWDIYHGWPDASQFVASFAPAAARTQGYLYAASQTHVIEYYTAQIDQARWNTGRLSLDLNAPTASYYTTQLRTSDYGLIALFYSTSFTSANLPPSLLTSPQAARVSTELLDLVGVNSGEPGLLALTQALEQDHAYRLMSVGPYDSAHQHGVFAIWQRVPR